MKHLPSFSLPTSCTLMVLSMPPHTSNALHEFGPWNSPKTHRVINKTSRIIALDFSLHLSSVYVDNKTSSGDFPVPLPCLRYFLSSFSWESPSSFFSFTPSLKNYTELWVLLEHHTLLHSPHSLVRRPRLKSLTLGVSENVSLDGKIFKNFHSPLFPPHAVIGS